MNKEKNFNSGHTTIETLSASIVSFLLKEGKVVIPESGYLELKVFPDKRTVLFKATENTTLFLASEGSIQSQIYDNISVPLKEGKVVTLPDVGIFRPMKNADGSYRVSYTISSALRKLLNDTKENETENPEIPEIPVKADDKKTLTLDVESADKEQSVAEKEVVKGKEKKEEKTVISVPKQEIGVSRKTPSYVRNASKVGDIVIPQEGKENNAAKTRGIIAAAVAAIIVLIFIVWYFMPDSKNKNNDRALVSGNNKTASVIEQLKETTESYESIDLPSLAERKYGNRIFWVYIYEANRDKISSPVNIPAGTDLRIPNLWEDYKVDVMDSMEIKRAGILSDIMLKQKIQL
jgi:hypothetical protein